MSGATLPNAVSQFEYDRVCTRLHQYIYTDTGHFILSQGQKQELWEMCDGYGHMTYDDMDAHESEGTIVDYWSHVRDSQPETKVAVNARLMRMITEWYADGGLAKRRRHTDLN